MHAARRLLGSAVRIVYDRPAPFLAEHRVAEWNRWSMITRTTVPSWYARTAPVVELRFQAGPTIGPSGFNQGLLNLDSKQVMVIYLGSLRTALLHIDLDPDKQTKGMSHHNASARRGEGSPCLIGRT